MPDYKEMYLKLFRATEDAISNLIKVQLECEEMYINAPEFEQKLYVLDSKHPEED
ncbi:MAG: hypothetical protein IJZ91_05985 [Oscillospiraceae bacterium]|nr:hypothetical protein [Oscillospiraceae bacterium]